MVRGDVFGSGRAGWDARAQSGVLAHGYHCNQARVAAPADFVN